MPLTAFGSDAAKLLWLRAVNEVDLVRDHGRSWNWWSGRPTGLGTVTSLPCMFQGYCSVIKYAVADPSNQGNPVPLVSEQYEEIFHRSLMGKVE
tara:strand:+ start:16583 stop:16864 length:282 start_codon:yes stop_codon:yes gene_type:complete